MNLNIISDLINYPTPLATEDYQVSGYLLSGDGRGGNFYWDPSSTAVSNYGTIFPSSTTPIGRWKRLLTTENINLGWFNIAGDGITDDTLTIQAAINSLTTGQTLEFPEASYSVTNVKLKGNTYYKGNNATIIQSTIFTPTTLAIPEVFQLYGAWDVSERTVTSISVVEVTLAVSSQIRLVSKLSGVNISGINVNDIIKIYSEDVIPNTSFPSRKLGEFAQVAEVGSADGGFILLNSTLRDSYSTNIRIGRMLGETVAIEGFKFTYIPSLTIPAISQSADTGKGGGAFIRLSGLVNPQIKNCTVTNSISNAIVIHSCFGYHVDNLFAKNLPDKPQNYRWGYAICDANSEFGNVTNSIFENVRHGFTTNTYNITPGESLRPANYGRSVFFNVSHCRAFGGFEAHFDTHDGAMYGTFNNCHSVNSNWGDDTQSATSLSASFDLRSSYTSLINCSAQSHCGIKVVTPSNQNGGDNLSTMVKGIRIEGFLGIVRRHGISVENAQVHISNSKIIRMQPSFATKAEHQLLNVIYGATLEAEALDIQEKGNHSNQAVAIRDANLIWNGGRIDLSEAMYDDNGTQINFRYDFIVVNGAESNHHICIKNIDLILHDRVISTIARVGSGPGFPFLMQNVNCYVTETDKTIIDGTTTVILSRRIIGGTYNANNIRIVNKFTHQQLNIDNFTYIDVTTGNIAFNNHVSQTALALDTFGRADKEIYLNINPPASTPAVSSILNGKFPGQSIVIRNIGASFTITVTTPSVVINPDHEALLRWNGTAWKLVYIS